MTQPRVIEVDYDTAKRMTSFRVDGRPYLVKHPTLKVHRSLGGIRVIHLNGVEVDEAEYVCRVFINGLSI